MFSTRPDANFALDMIGGLAQNNLFAPPESALNGREYAVLYLSESAHATVFLQWAA